MVDSGSPISLIKESFVSRYLCKPVRENVSQFRGINGSPLEVLTIFEHKFEIENIPLSLKFYVVSDTTMDCNAILGRDFITKRNIQVILNQKITVKKVSKNDLHNNDKSMKFCLSIALTK